MSFNIQQIFDVIWANSSIKQTKTWQGLVWFLMYYSRRTKMLMLRTNVNDLGVLFSEFRSKKMQKFHYKKSGTIWVLVIKTNKVNVLVFRQNWVSTFENTSSVSLGGLVILEKVLNKNLKIWKTF